MFWKYDYCCYWCCHCFHTVVMWLQSDKQSWQSKLNLFSLPVSNTAEANCGKKRLLFRCWSEGLMCLTISNWLQGEGWPLDLNLGKLSQVRSEILYFPYVGYSETAPCRLGLQAASLLVFKVGHRVSDLMKADREARRMSDFFYSMSNFYVL